MAVKKQKVNEPVSQNFIMSREFLSSLIREQRYDEALTLGRQLTAAMPADVSLWMLLANVQASLGRYEEAVSSCDQIIALQPGNADAHSNRGIALYTLRRLKMAESAFRAALAINPSLVSAGNNLGMLLKDMGRNEEALEVIERVLTANPALPARQQASIYANLALVQLRANLFESGERSCRAALRLDPSCVQAHNNLAQALKEQGRIAESVAQQRVAIALAPDRGGLHSNLLFDLNYLSDSDKRDLAREHKMWGERHAAGAPYLYVNIPDPERRIRVGYVSPDFRAHSVAFFIEPLLVSHDRRNVEVFCYANLIQGDAVTDHLRLHSDHWCNVWSMDDGRFAERVRADRIDILVDLAGHTSGNRLKVFGMKPAPVQVTWLGYPNTTGLRQIDYRFTDEWADPPGDSDAFHTERLVRLPHGFLCYKPLDDSPAVAQPPNEKNGYVTFGCFNNSAKVNAFLLDVWSTILQELPNSRLLLKSRQLLGPDLQKRLHDGLAQRGVDAQRVEILGRVRSTTDHLALYGNVDIALDTFPYNGTTTTCEALWMGVPVIAMAGDRHAGRVGVSLLRGLGLDELIASTPDDYRRVAVELATDPVRMAGYRTALRERMRCSALTDAAGFARDIEAVYRVMWRKWCEDGLGAK